MAMFIHIFFMFPDRMPKTLEEIDELFQPGAPSAWKTKVRKQQAHLRG